MAISEPKSAHLREVLLFAFNWKKSATEAHRMIEEVYSDHALSKSQCYRWFKKFQSGDFELDNEPRGKPPQKFEDAELQALLDEDSTQMQEKLAKQLQVSQGAVSLRLNSLGMTQKLSRWVPRDNPTRQKSWGLPGQFPKQTPRPNRFGKKAMLCIWWDQTGVVYFELLKPGKMVNTSRYEQQMHSLREALNEKRPEWREKHNNLILQHDNAPAHNTTFGSLFKEFAHDYGFTHVTSSPRYPQSNGFIESFVKIVKERISKSKDPYLALLAYRATPLANGFSPAELSMGRRKLFKGKKQKYYFYRAKGVRELPPLDVNDRVWLTDLKTPGVIISKADTPRSYMVDTPRGRVRRNRFHLLPTGQRSPGPPHFEPDEEPYINYPEANTHTSDAPTDVTDSSTSPKEALYRTRSEEQFVRPYLHKTSILQVRSYLHKTSILAGKTISTQNFHPGRYDHIYTKLPSWQVRPYLYKTSILAGKTISTQNFHPGRYDHIYTKLPSWQVRPYLYKTSILAGKTISTQNFHSGSSRCSETISQVLPSPAGCRKRIYPGRYLVDPDVMSQCDKMQKVEDLTYPLDNISVQTAPCVAVNVSSTQNLSVHRDFWVLRTSLRI
ncbi:SETMAR [Cordylochernes scorpioides]|uniref:SETMAR n=1 Tax=Cordylochernes scorpioides TaxID=51811 RepID=A0ABY6K497_9ARAC|nr:SETMAR [Cordylochernes scorpioides]